MTEIKFDEKYGKVVDHILLAEGSYKPVLVSLMSKDGKMSLDIRSMYYAKDGSLAHGKGIRLPVDDDVAEEVLEAAQAILFAHGFIDMD